MKRAFSFFLCALVLLPLLGGCRKKEPNIVFTGVIEEVREKSLLVLTSDDVGFQKASVGFAPGLKAGFGLAVGQTVKITILPEIRESYPVQVTAVAIELISQPEEPDETDETIFFFRTVSKEREGSFDFLLSRAENSEMLFMSSVRHLPVMLFSDSASLRDFMDAGMDYFEFSQTYEGEKSFADALPKYDDAFFGENSLLLLYTSESSGSIRHRVEAGIADGKFTAVIEEIVPDDLTDDMAYWFILLEFPKDALAGCSRFDAYYG